MAIKYLQSHDSEGTIDYLINGLYKEEIYFIDFYLPQLCYLAITKLQSRSIKKFLIDMSIKYSNIALKCHMYLFSFSQDDGILKERADDLYTTIETAVINKDVP